MDELEKAYQAQIASSVHVEDILSNGEIICIISSIRNGLGLPVCLNNMMKNRVKELLSSYVAEPIFSAEIDEKTNKPIIDGNHILINLSINN
jgi:type III secretory pathway component EscR